MFTNIAVSSGTTFDLPVYDYSKNVYNTQRFIMGENCVGLVLHVEDGETLPRLVEVFEVDTYHETVQNFCKDGDYFVYSDRVLSVVQTALNERSLYADCFGTGVTNQNYPPDAWVTAELVNSGLPLWGNPYA